MTPVKAADDLAVDDLVEVVEHRTYGSQPTPRRGTVIRVGKVAAVIAFADGSEESIRFVKRVIKERGGRFRGTYRDDFHPISKLSAREIWRLASPSNSRVWRGGTDAPTIIVRATDVRDNLDLVIEDLRAYRDWLRREPKEDNRG